jgi:hypothetical protein
MTDPTTTIESMQGVVRERRRPGRPKYTNPHLVALMRNSTEVGSTARGQGGETTRWDHLKIAPKESSLSQTISVIDGASQVGSPDRSSYSKHDSWNFSDGLFLGNQVCYVAGVLVASARGVVPAESLIAGDVVLTHSGDKRVTWTRQLDLNPIGGPHPERCAPVRLRPDAIAPGLPETDLLVSPSHCLWVESRLVPARLLINGLTIVQDLDTTFVRYCHVLFDQASTGQLAGSPERVAPIWHTLANRAKRLGYVRSSYGGMPNRDVHLLVDGKPADPIDIDGNRWIFIVPSGHQVVRLVSPGHAAVLRIETISQNEYEVIPADHPDLVLGWGPCEHDGQMMWRCVSGVAQLPMGHITQNAKIVVHLKS